MRTSRSNGSKTYNYVYNGSQLTQMTVGNDTLYFTYGVFGPTTVTWNGETYYYALNGQGDVTGIFDEEGTLVVIYNWDNAWGYNPQPEGSLANTLGTLNPLCYRGYVYDTETGFYYLQSRYYDPEIGRFINADGIMSTVGGDICGYNLFAYCFNNPVNMIDSSGRWPQWIEDIFDWVDDNIVQPVVNFFSPSTNTISGQFQEGIIQGSGSLTGGYSDIMFRGQINQQMFPVSKEASATIGAFGKVSGGNASGKIGIGNTNVSISAKGVGDVLTATGQAGLTYKDGLGIKLKAKAAVATGRATIEFNIFGWQIELGVYGDALAIGAEATIGIFEGGFEAKVGASALFGGGFIFRVKPT